MTAYFIAAAAGILAVAIVLLAMRRHSRSNPVAPSPQPSHVRVVPAVRDDSPLERVA